METGFFKWLWRFNALAIALAVLVILALVVVEFWPSRRIHAVQVVNVDAKDSSRQQKLSYGPPKFDTAQNTMTLPLYLSQDYEVSGAFSSSYRKDSDLNQVNQLIVQLKDGSNHWLFAGYDQLIVWQRALTRPRADAPKQRETVAWIYEVVRADSNGDKRLSLQDKKTLMIAKPDRSQLSELISGYDMMTAPANADEGRFDALVQNGDSWVLYQFDIDTDQKRNAFPLPALPDPK